MFVTIWLINLVFDIQDVMIVLVYNILPFFCVLSDTLQPHLQVGNVYVKFRDEDDAANILVNLKGRYYDGGLIFRCFISCLMHFVSCLLVYYLHII